MTTAKVGDVFSVDLRSTPTTGYQWQPTALPAGIDVVDTGFTPASTAPGDGGTQHFRLRGTEPGTYDLTFQLVRSWQPDPVNTQTIRVEITR